MKNLKFLIIILFLFIFYSCEKGSGDPSLKVTYNRLMAGMDLSCPESDSESYMKAVIDNTQVCHFDNVEDRSFTHRYFTHFTTAGPNTTIGVEDSEVKRRIRLSFEHDFFIEGEDYIQLWLPLVGSEVDRITYLKRFFEKEEYKIKDLDSKDEDVMIRLRMIDIITETGGLGYDISSEYGDQKSSYLRVKNVNIKENDETIRFDFELEFECSLYHLAQNGREGLWSELTEGILKAEIELEK